MFVGHQVGTLPEALGGKLTGISMTFQRLASTRRALALRGCRIEELELTVLNRQDVIQHLNQDVEKMVSQLADLGRLKAEAQQQAQKQINGLTASLKKAADDRDSFQQQTASLQTALSRQTQVSKASKIKGIYVIPTEVTCCSFSGGKQTAALTTLHFGHACMHSKCRVCLQSAVDSYKPLLMSLPALHVQEAAERDAQLSAEVEAVQSKASSDQSALAAEISGLKDRLRSAESQSAALQHDLSREKEQLASLQQEHAQLQQAHSEQTASASAVKQDLDSLQAQHAEKCQAMEALQRESDDLQQRHAAQAESMEQLRGELATVQQKSVQEAADLRVQMESVSHDRDEAQKHWESERAGMAEQAASTTSTIAGARSCTCATCSCQYLDDTAKLLSQNLPGASACPSAT